MAKVRSGSEHIPRWETTESPVQVKLSVKYSKCQVTKLVMTPVMTMVCLVIFFLVHGLLGTRDDDFIPSHRHKAMSATGCQCAVTVAGAALAKSYLSKLSIQCLVHVLFVYVCSKFYLSCLMP